MHIFHSHNSSRHIKMCSWLFLFSARIFSSPLSFFQRLWFIGTLPLPPIFIFKFLSDDSSHLSVRIHLPFQFSLIFCRLLQWWVIFFLIEIWIFFMYYDSLDLSKICFNQLFPLSFWHCCDIWSEGKGHPVAARWINWLLVIPKDSNCSLQPSESDSPYLTIITLSWSPLRADLIVYQWMSY